MGFQAPSPPAPDADERELLLGFLGWQRAQVVAAADGLTDEQLRWTPDGRLLSVGGVLNHLTHVERRWIDGRYLGSEFPPRIDEFALAEGTSRATLIDTYWQRAEQTDAVVRAAPGLAAPCLGDEGGRGPAHTLLGFDNPITLRWIVLHLIEETAHHAGHADSTREMLDGTKLRT